MKYKRNELFRQQARHPTEQSFQRLRLPHQTTRIACKQKQCRFTVVIVIGLPASTESLFVADLSIRLHQHSYIRVATILQQHPFNGLFSTTTWVSQYQNGKTSLYLNEARYNGVWQWQWHQLDHMQTMCTSPQTDNHTNTSSTGQMLFLMPN